MEANSPIFGLGQCALDYIGLIAAYPPPNVKCEFANLVTQGGGPVATALVALSRWRLPCYFAGIVGNDAFGVAITDSFREEGIDIGGLVVRRGHSSQFAFIISEPDAGRRTIFWQRPTGMSLQPDELDLKVLQKSRVLHTDGLFTEASLFACRKAREASIPVVVDAGTLREGMLDIVPLSDCFIVAETFSQAIAEDPLETCYMLAGLGARFTGVTLGAKGYIALVDGRIIKKPAYRTQAIDTTGCGDVFHAGVTYGIVQGWDAEKCLDLGAWAAAMVSTQMGGRKGIPTYTSLKERG
ncbi:MAG TPA: PfkB family carbohydrate kinase [Syntrophales bacterium]|nr:PfkB family carbohydrate kinase [Syntrophales bacterium]